MKMTVALAVCLLLQLSAVRGEDTSPSSSSSSSSFSSSDKASVATTLNSSEDLSRVKRAVDMRRLARGIQMLRLGKRSMPLWLPANRAFQEDETLLQDLLNARDSPYYDQQEFPAFSEDALLLHPRYRRSAENRPSYHSEEEASADVKRSMGFLDSREENQDDEGFVAGKIVVHKNPMNVMRLDKRPVNMLRLGKRPMRMLRLGKREDLDEDQLNAENDLFYPSGYDEEGVSADKRPMKMLRLGKRPVNMLHLGKRPMSMLRLGKRPISMLRLGKRPMSMLRLGKRPVNMLRLGKRQLPMLRLGKRAAE